MLAPLRELERRPAAGRDGPLPLPPVVRATLLKAVDDGPQAVALFDPDDRIAYANGPFRQAWSVLDPTEASFASVMRSAHQRGQGAVIATTDIEGWIAAATRRRREGPAFRAFEVDFCDGRWFWITERRLDEGWILSLGQDITALKNSEQTMRAARDAAVQASLTDPLTQLGNRRRAMQRLEEFFALGRPFPLALIDIDHFKPINGAYGHAAGDALLVDVASRLEALGKLGFSVARLAGDEFAVIGPPELGRAGFDAALRGFMEGFGKPVPVGDVALPVSVSVGVAQAFTDGSDVGELLVAADAALYAAKLAGRGTCRRHEPAMGERRREEAELRRDMAPAFERNEFTPFFQPIVDIRTGRVASYEILARWRHPRLGLLSPDRFLPLFSAGADLTRLTGALLGQAGRAVRGWDPGLRFAFNTAAEQLSRGALLPMLDALAADGSFALDRLEMEITEAALLRDPREAAAVVEAVRERGVSVALDDFGIGFSSLHHLREIRFDRVKVDRSFLRGLESPRNHRFLGALIHLAKELDLAVTVEGIETPALEAAARELGCDCGQGFLYGAPMPASDVARAVLAA